MRLAFFILALMVFPALAVQVVGEAVLSNFLELDSELPIGACTEVRLGQGKELAIYKDFTLLGMIEIDPVGGDRIKERPLLGSFTGVLFLNRLGPERRLKNLGILVDVVGQDKKAKAGPESFFAPVMLCGENAYSGFLGYFDVEALRLAKEDSYSDSLPPSTSGNKIPRLRPDLN
ncbi:MAG: hypothetical protein HYR96_07025 [Deltaproteobacteria bacterium]|nr:hypothetical protein [Deltaproteobacteria bacterium]MBI3295346.1 hypothetical protein [Deltaproteobacteria bacterium]